MTVIMSIFIKDRKKTGDRKREGGERDREGREREREGERERGERENGEGDREGKRLCEMKKTLMWWSIIQEALGLGTATTS